MKQEKWILRGGRGASISQETNLPPFIAKVIATRLQGQDLKEYLNKDLPVFDPCLLKDLPEACGFLNEAFLKGKKAAVVGDYDVDGMTSASILYLGFSYLYPGIDLTVRIPDRVKDGYGFSLGIAKELLQQHTEVVITCDNGIREFETASFLETEGVSLIITDHHEIEQDPQGKDLIPKALYAINPHRQEDQSPLSSICGAFVAYQLIRQMALNQGKDPETDPLLLQLKGYAAIGTVCDVMPLVQDNRRLVYQGLKALEQNPTVGIRELMHQASLRQLDPYSVGFGIGPMINSGGRLRSQQDYLGLLTGSDPALCREKAVELYGLNKERQAMTDTGITEGMLQLEKHPEDMVKVIYLPDLHESIAGLVAGKLKEMTNHPVFVMTNTEGKIKGSGRSVEAYHMFNKMNEHEELFEKFGGHAMAAGFTLSPSLGKEAVEEFRLKLNQDAKLSEEDLYPVVYIDAAVDPTKLRVDSVSQIDKIGPFGTGNPKPLFACKNLQLRRCQIFGKRRNVMRLLLSNGSAECETVMFSPEEVITFLKENYGEVTAREGAEGKYFSSRVLVDIVYQAEIDSYYGVPSVKLYLRHYRKSLDDK